MGKIIAVSGKGGTGKTTIASLIIKALLESNAGTILAVDADPNSTLADALGLRVEDTLSSICEEMLKEKENLPAGMTKDRYLEYRIQQSLVEEGDLALLVMGRPEGPGCYCYANNLLREIVKDLTESYKFTVIDNEAGMEHLSRKTMRRIDILFVISDFSTIGVRSAARIYKLANEMGINLGKSFLIVNKVRPVRNGVPHPITNPAAQGAICDAARYGISNGVKDGISSLQKEIEKSGLALVGTLPFASEIEELSVNSRALSELPKESEIIKKVDEIVNDAVLK
ncbi:MAG: carbon monoxide dehydrogenase [Candidatus Omnitrophica bacterium]|nr:carbon monoxide dehydrogenase [Candidatus Omnitrophota bacterium]